MLGWVRGGFHKECTGARYAKLVLLHPVVTETHEGLNPYLSVDMEDNSIGIENQCSRPNYNRPKTMRLSNRYTNFRG
jgi:hypothetical protein